MYKSEILNATEWLALVHNLKSLIKLYGLGNVSDAMQHIMITEREQDAQ